MKKLVLLFGALALALGVFAEEKANEKEELQLFDSFVAGLKKSTPEDAEVRGDREHRFVYLDLLMPVDSQAPLDLAEAKKGVVMYLKSSAELFANLKITVLVNFVTTDRKIRTVVVTPQELKSAAAVPEDE